MADLEGQAALQSEVILALKSELDEAKMKQA